MAPSPKFTMEQIINAVRALWSENGAAPLPNTVRTRVGGGDPDRLEAGISLVGVEYGIDCAYLDRQPAEIRALVTDPRGPTGLLPLDPLTRELLPEGALTGALTILRAVAAARSTDQTELERRVHLERTRADVVAESCERRVTAALAAQLSAEQRYASQDAEHERNTRELRDQLAASQERVRVLEQDAPKELVTLTNAITKTGDAVNDLSNRLAKVERTVRPAASAPRAASGDVRQRKRAPKPATRGAAVKPHAPTRDKGREAPVKPIVRRPVRADTAPGDSTPTGE